jgi:homoserine O-acetyltransferase
MRKPVLCAVVSIVALIPLACVPPRALLFLPDSAELRQPAPEAFHVKLHTTKGDVTLDIQRKFAPHGVDRFYHLVVIGYYDDMRLTRVVKDRWAQFGINGNPAIAKIWRDHPIPDDPRVLSNVRGTIAFAFAVPNGRTTQVFINLGDNSATNDAGGFAPLGSVSKGMDVVDKWYAEYGENAGGGIRAGKQGPLFDGGNAYIDANFPKLDSIIRATVVR